MAVAQGYGKTITSGSVFAYDVADSRNSYIGEPTVNIHANSENVSSWTGNLFGNWIDSGVSSNTVVAPNGTLTGDIIGDGFGRFNASSTATPGQTYTYSVYLKNVTLTSGFYIWYAFGLNGSLVSYGSPLFIPITSINTSEWTRFTVTVTAPGSGINQVQFGPCPFIGYNYGSTYSSPTYNASGTQLAVWGGQIEQKSHVTPYTAGTRSATQGLLPIVGNSTIDLTNVSFDSNAQMVFDGTNDRFNTGIGNIGNNTSFAAVINSSGNATTYNMYMGQLLPYMGALSGNQIIFSDYINSIQQTIYTSVGTIITGQNHYVVCTREYDGTNTTNKVYIDGKLSTSGTFSGAPTYYGDNIHIGDGQTSAWYPFYGKINVVQIYNRTLSSSEVQQNYRHYKTRFNLS